MKGLDEDQLDNLDEVKPTNFDLLILDYHMPMLTGLEVIKKCMPKYKQKQVPLPKVIFVTAVDDNEIRTTCEKYSDYFLNKPILYNSLYNCFQQMKMI